MSFCLLELKRKIEDFPKNVKTLEDEGKLADVSEHLFAYIKQRR